MNLFRILIVVMVCQVYAYVHTHQHVYTKCVQLFVSQSHFNKSIHIYKRWANKGKLQNGKYGIHEAKTCDKDMRANSIYYLWPYI